MTSLVKRQCGRVGKTLKSVVYKEFLRKAMIPIVCIEVALIVFYFFTVNYMTDKSVEIMSQTAKQSLINLSGAEARYIENKFKDIERKTKAFQEMHRTSIEILYDSFAEEVLPSNLPWNSGVLILSATGNVLASSKQYQKIKGDDSVAMPTPYNSQKRLVLGQTPVETELKILIAERSKSKEFTAQGERYFVTSSLISVAGWKLLIVTDLKSVYEPMYKQKEESRQFGYLVILLIINFYVAFFIYLLIASKRFANRITQPITKISQFISHMNQHNVEDAPVSYVKIKELDELIDLNVEIQEAKQKYRKTNLEISYKNQQLERLAVTDPLTQAFNRLKLDEVLSYEIARARRDKTPLSTVLLDVDKFKNVNDTYGHQVGDSVLVELTQLLLKSIRRTDIFGRWGGEEFLLILPNTNLSNAGKQAEKLRRLIETTKFAEVGSVTASFGVSSSIDNSTERSLIEVADQALYEAKKSGRNQVRCQEKAMPTKLQLVKFLDERSAGKK